MTRIPAQIEWIEAQVRGRPGFRLMVILSAPGCAYARATGGCTNCGFPSVFGTGSAVSAEDYLAQVKTALNRIPPETSVPVEIDLYNSGSFLNPDEVSEEAQVALLSLAGAHPRVASLLIETRPEYVTASRLKRAVNACQGKPLEIGIGLESADAEILKERIRKGYTWDDFAAAAILFAESGASLLAYVLLKPMGIAEREAIEDSVVTAQKVFELGRALPVPTRVALEPCFVTAQTPLYHEFKQGRYRPAWLWSVIEVVLRIAPLGSVAIGLSDEGMNSLQAPHNCERCNQRVRDALLSFNQTQNVSPLRDLSCDCRGVWLEQLGFPRY